MNNRKLTKNCEICNCDITKIKHKHHIIPRTDPRSTDYPSNLAYICPNCHHLVHAGEIIIEGVFLSSSGHKLFFHKKDEPYTVRPGIFLLDNGMANIVDGEE